jgi:glycosyltransferase 2 family protein
MVVDSARDLRSGALVLHPHAGWLALSALVVLANFALLIASWLYIVSGLSGRSIPFFGGARIWFISSLGSLLPGRVWGIIQMGAMSVDVGISPTAAAGASIINAGVNIATGMAIGLITSSPIIASLLVEHRVAAWTAWLIAGIAVAGILALPILVPWGFGWLRRRGMAVPEQRLPPRIIAVAAFANLAAWFLYGAAFLCLNRGLVDPAAHSITQHTAAFTTSYVIGYMMIVAPAGIGFREASLQQILLAAGMATAAQATALTLISRIWLLIIQLLPALIFLAYRRPPNEKDPAG